MNHLEAEQYAASFGDAFYLFDEQRFLANYDSLLSAFRSRYANTHIAYSYKTNYTPTICHKVDALGGYAEVVSSMEYALAKRVGVCAERIVYNGPMKSAESFREALTGGSIVNLDSDRDLRLLLEAAQQHSGPPGRVGIRCNFPLEGYADSRFGFDVEGAAFHRAVDSVKSLKNVRLAGLHCHFPDRELRSFSARTKMIVEVAQRTFDRPPQFISVGGGFFGRMPQSMKARYPDGVPTYEDYGSTVGDILAATYGRDGAPILFIEPGTSVVADTFSFVARVVDIKRVRSRNLACIAGSMFNVSPYARSQNLPIAVLRNSSLESQVSATETCDVVGYTCIENDVLRKALPGPLGVGDFVEFSNVGSYSVVMKPPFILPSVPIIMRSASGEHRMIKAAESNEYIFQNFTFAPWN